MKVAILGCGNMGMAFAKSFISYDLVKTENLLLIEKSIERGEALRAEKAGLVIETITENVAEYDLLILSVKPQDFIGAAAELKVVIKPNQVVLSIMAGIPIEKIQQLLGHQAVMRAMPNSPAMIGMGMTAFCASDSVPMAQLRKVENLINSTGKALYLESESLIDAVTALSGSGPAYFFYVVKAMIEAGKSLGFDEATAATLVKQTMLGSFHLINNADKSLDQLIKAVASKGGTTEAALATFQETGVANGLIAGIDAAQKRAVELSK